jgi:hypothetical protein
MDLTAMGNRLAEREGFRSARGMDAIRLYLMRRFNWTPAQILQMGAPDLELVLREELEASTMGAVEARPAPLTTR